MCYLHASTAVFNKSNKIILNSKRCLQIRCMSQACRESLRLIFGQEVYKKSVLSYPSVSLIKKKLVDIQYNISKDPFGWRYKVCD